MLAQNPAFIVDSHFTPWANHLYRKPSDDFKEAAVLAILLPKNNQWQLIFIERTSNHPEDKHAGQISFPGGKRELGESYLECALRETWEEIGLRTDQLTIAGPLEPIYISVSNFMVYPFLAFAECNPVYTKSPEEVKTILEIPLSHLLDPTYSKYKDLVIGDRTLKNVPYYDLNGSHLWGATAIMTAQILQLIKSIVKT